MSCSRPTSTTAPSNSGAPRPTSAFRKLRKNPSPTGDTSACSTTPCWPCAQVRPQVIVATFVGGVSDGHGQHQVSGEIAQEVFKAAGDPEGLSRATERRSAALAAAGHVLPDARLRASPAKGCSTTQPASGRRRASTTTSPANGPTGAPSTDVTIPVGAWDPVLGRSYVQIARQGWGEQKSQNGGANPTLSGPSTSSYHLWAVAPQAAAAGAAGLGSSGPDASLDASLFDNRKVKIDTSLEGLAASGEGHSAGMASQMACGKSIQASTSTRAIAATKAV